MKPKNCIWPVSSIQRAFFEDEFGAPLFSLRCTFFSWLENEQHSAMNLIAVPRQHLSNPHQDRGVCVMPTRMHNRYSFALALRCHGGRERKTGFLFDW